MVSRILCAPSAPPLRPLRLGGEPALKFIHRKAQSTQRGRREKTARPDDLSDVAPESHKSYGCETKLLAGR